MMGRLAGTVDAVRARLSRGPDGDAVPEVVTGWGGTPASAAVVARPSDVRALTAAATHAGPRGAITRGLGRAYGDAAMNAGGLVVDATGVAGLLALDESGPVGVARVLGGTSIDALLRAVVPRGWFVPVTPGTRFVTIGGAIAADVHGKNHHAVGTFGRHVRSLVLALPDGSTRVLTPEGTPAEFWATCGGMGLTGTIVEATVALPRIYTSLVTVDTDRAPDLEGALALLTEGEHRYPYSVAWLDLLATGRSLGRSVVTQGDFAPLAALDGLPQRADPLAYAPRPPVPSPPAPAGLLNRGSIRLFNELWYRKAPVRRRDELQSIAAFFHPLDLIDGWNRLYGPRGFLQWQCLVPFGAEDVLRGCIEALSAHGAASFLTVLKRFGPTNPAPLSFPGPGWTLTLDVAAGSPALGEVLDRLDRDVLDAGGRLYLAKESRMRPELVAPMYPRLDEWRAVRASLDPDGVLQSDLARRLNLLG
jgi:decaprenylphospho-beta-D-ribofuranose 2-oxidase